MCARSCDSGVYTRTPNGILPPHDPQQSQQELRFFWIGEQVYYQMIAMFMHRDITIHYHYDERKKSYVLRLTRRPSHIKLSPACHRRHLPHHDSTIAFSIPATWIALDRKVHSELIILY